MATFKEVSKTDWIAEKTSLENINAGSLQRIADATELISKNYIQMQRDLDFYKKRYADQGLYIQKLNARISALKGVITKIKKKFLIKNCAVEQR